MEEIEVTEDREVSERSTKEVKTDFSEIIEIEKEIQNILMSSKISGVAASKIRTGLADILKITMKLIEKNVQLEGDIRVNNILVGQAKNYADGWLGWVLWRKVQKRTSCAKK